MTADRSRNDTAACRTPVPNRNRPAAGLFAAVVVGAGLLTLDAAPLMAQVVLHDDFELDLEEPEACPSCHDGTTASDIGFCSPACPIDLSFSHPVYRRYPPVGKEWEFVSRFRVEASGIQLRDGEVTCSSCHDLQSREKFLLVMSNRRSRLCLSCHVR